MLRLLLLSSLLAGCWTHEARITDCMFGAPTEAQAYGCAVRNFGAKGAHMLRERQFQCSNSLDPNWVAVNCPRK